MPRVARVARGLLLLLGCLLLSLLPVGWTDVPYVEASRQDMALLGIADGSLQLVYIHPSTRGSADWQVGFIDDVEWTFLSLYQDTSFWPSARREVLCLNADGHDVAAAGVPLWLLAGICLAWPVTSFILARRRRRGRGFEVETSAPASTPLPPGEVAAQRSGADGEGGREV